MPSEHDELVIAHLPIVRRIALGMRADLPSGIDLDDLVQAGSLGLIGAAKTYDPQKGVPFAAFATYRIRGAILDWCRDEDWMSRYSRTTLKRVEQARKRLADTSGSAPGDEDTSAEAGISLYALRSLRTQLLSTCISAVIERVVPADRSDWPDAQTTEREMKAAVRDALRALKPRARQILGLYYEKGITMKAIGMRLGLSESRVSQIVNHASRRLRSNLRERGIESVAAFKAAA